MYADFIISMGMFTRRDNNGNLKAKDAFIGLEMVGKATYDAEVTLKIEARSALVLKICHLCFCHCRSLCTSGKEVTYSLGVFLSSSKIIYS